MLMEPPGYLYKDRREERKRHAILWETTLDPRFTTIALQALREILSTLQLDSPNSIVISPDIIPDRQE